MDNVNLNVNSISVHVRILLALRPLRAQISQILGPWAGAAAAAQ